MNKGNLAQEQRVKFDDIGPILRAIAKWERGVVQWRSVERIILALVQRDTRSINAIACYQTLGCHFVNRELFRYINAGASCAYIRAITGGLTIGCKKTTSLYSRGLFAPKIGFALALYLFCEQDDINKAEIIRGRGLRNVVRREILIGIYSSLRKQTNLQRGKYLWAYAIHITQLKKG